MIDTYFPCPQKYHYAYLEGGTGIVPVVESYDLRFGRLVHAGLAAYYEHGRSLNRALVAMEAEYGKEMNYILEHDQQIWDEDRERWAQANALASGMLTHYAEWDAHQEAYGSDKPLKVEWAFKVPIGEDAVFRGVLDLLTDDSGLYIWDHKTASTFDASWEALNHLDRQFRRYAWAVQMLLDCEVTGFIVNGLRKKLPVVPEVLKKGGLSQRKDIDTTPEVYRGAIRDNGLAEDDYADMLEILDAKGNTFFRRDIIRYNQTEIEEAGEELRSISRYLMANGQPFKVSSPLCTKFRPCPYKSICVEDTPEARMMFRAKERREFGDEDS
jgi:hypothetical protein